MNCPTCGRAPSERTRIDWGQIRIRMRGHAMEPAVTAFPSRCPDPIHDLADRVGEMREALEKILRGYFPEPFVADVLPSGPGISEDEVGLPGPWHGVKLPSGEVRGWSKHPYPMTHDCVGSRAMSNREMADVARTALRTGETT